MAVNSCAIAGSASGHTLSISQRVGYLEYWILKGIYDRCSFQNPVAIPYLFSELPDAVRIEVSRISACTDDVLITDLPRLAKAIKQFIDAILDDLDERARASVETCVWDIAGKPQVPYYYGQVHAKDDTPRLLEAFEMHHSVSLHTLPPELLLRIFDYLDKRSLQSATCVDRRLADIGSDQQLILRNPQIWFEVFSTICPDVRIIGPSFWAEFGVDVSDLSLPDFVEVKAAIDDLFQHVEVVNVGDDLIPQYVGYKIQNRWNQFRTDICAGMTVLVIPGEFSLNQLFAFAQDNGLPLQVTIDLTASGDVPFSSKSYICVISNSILKKTRNKPYDLQLAQVEGLGYEPPRIGEAALLMVTQSLDNTRPRGGDISTFYTRCKERQVSVGGDPNISPSIILDLSHFINKGMFAVRKF